MTEVIVMNASLSAGHKAGLLASLLIYVLVAVFIYYTGAPKK